MFERFKRATIVICLTASFALTSPAVADAPLHPANPSPSPVVLVP